MNDMLLCMECIFYVPKLVKGEDIGFGDCHRFPPGINGGSISRDGDDFTFENSPIGAWPGVAESDFCGELVVKQTAAPTPADAPNA